MSKLRVSKIEPASGSDVALGTSGDNVVVSGNTIKIAKMVDAGGNTLFQSSSGTVSNVNSGLSGAGPSWISGVNVTGVSSISVTSGIDSTYSEYWIIFSHLQPDTNSSYMRISWTTDGTNFNVSQSTGYFRIYNDTGSSNGATSHETGNDVHNATSGANLIVDFGADGGEYHSGILKLYNPASTTLSPTYTSRIAGYHASDYAQDHFVSGIIHSPTTAITGYKLDFSSGGFNASGRIDLYGVK